MYTDGLQQTCPWNTRVSTTPKGSTMSYPQPTKGLWPEKPNRPLPPRVPRTNSPDEFVPYPPPTTGRGIPAKFLPIAPVTLFATETFQLNPVLLDVEGKLQRPTERLRYASNNLRIPVSDAGLITTNLPATTHSRRGASERGHIQVSHGVIDTLVEVLVRTDFDDIVSD